MGRKIKRGLEYFPMNVDIASDIKIRKLIKYNKGQAFTVYSLLLCYIYKNGYYTEWDDDLPFILSELCGFDEEYIKSVIEYCVSIELFDKGVYENNKVLTSRSIQERYSNICKQGGRKNPITEYNLISSEEIPISSEKMTQTKQNKIKINNKQKESIYPPPQTPPPCGVVVSSSGGGGGRNKNLYEELCKAVALRDDVYDATAITGGWQNQYCEYYAQWLALSKEQQQAFPLNVHNQTLCTRDKLSPDYDRWHALCWVKDNTLHAEYLEIYALSTSDKALFELRRLIKECKKGKITMPGKFIIKHLKALP